MLGIDEPGEVDYPEDDGTLNWWRNRPCGACGHKARSHIGTEKYCGAYSETEQFHSCHCNAFVETASAESIAR